MGEAGIVAITEEADTWKTLLAQALRVIDSLEAAGYGRLDVRLGGGTVLMLALDHRFSRDIDIFFDDAQALGFLSPRLNDTAAGLAGAYVEQGNSLKLVCEAGDIAFIVAGTVIPGAPRGTLDVDGRAIVLDGVAEILAKKLLYRAASLKPRDVFDVAAALEREPAAARSAIDATRSMHDVLLRRLDTLAGLDPGARALDIHPIGDAARLVDHMVGTVRQAVLAGSGRVH